MEHKDYGGSVAGLAAVRIVVVPCGAMEDRAFQTYLAALRSFSRVQLFNMTPPTSEVPAQFRHQDWQTGRMAFNFVTAEEAAVPNDWEDFQAHRRVMGVVGLIHCRQCKDLRLAHAEFLRVLKTYNTCFAARCFAVEPDESQDDMELEHLVMIPQAQGTRLKFYLSTLLLDFAANLLREFNLYVFDIDQQAKIASPFDQISTTDDVNRLRKRRPGRIRKCVGDYCLLAGSPSDAMLNWLRAAVGGGAEAEIEADAEAAFAE